MIFFLIQVLGGLFMAVAAIASLLKSKPFDELEIPSPIIGGSPRKERRLSRATKIGATCVVVGWLFTNLAGLISQSINNKRNLQNQESTARQIRLLNEQNGMLQETLTQIQHVVTRFQDASVYTSVEIPADDFDLESTVSKGIQSVSKMRNTNTDFSLVERPFRQTSNVYSVATVGYVTEKNGGVTTFAFEPTRAGPDFIINIDHVKLEKARKSSRDSRDQTEKLLEFVKAPVTILRLWRNDSRRYQPPDFCALGEVRTDVKLEYLYPGNHIRISWSTVFPSANWTNNARVVSMPDLGGAAFCIELPNFPARRGPPPALPTLDADALKSAPPNTKRLAPVTSNRAPELTPEEISKLIKSGFLPPPPSNLRIIETPPAELLGDVTNIVPVNAVIIFNTIPIQANFNKWGRGVFFGIYGTLPPQDKFMAGMKRD
jgi:hypothetical protein